MRIDSRQRLDEISPSRDAHSFDHARDATPTQVGEGDRSHILHRLSRLHHRLQVRERGAAVGDPYLREVRRRGLFPETRRAFQVTRCNQCEDAPCVTACPTTAMFRRPTESSTSSSRSCIGCKACIAACPYDAIFINPEDHAAEKCNFCAHRLDMGLEPACVVVCPTKSILIGDLNDPASRVAQIVHSRIRGRASARKGNAPQAVLQGRASGHARSAGGRPSAGRSVHVERAGTSDPGTRRVRASRPTIQLGRGSCWPTTCLTRRRGAGGSASTRGRSRSPRERTWCRSDPGLDGRLSWRITALDDGRAHRVAAFFWRSRDGC